MSRTTRTFTIRLALASGTLAVGCLLAPAGATISSAAPLPTASVVSTAPGQPKFGDRGAAVVALQTAIMKNGFTLKGGADGVFDARTRKVLRTFQRVVGLKVTGVVDAATVAVLKLDAPEPSTTTSTTSTSTTAVAAAPVFPMTVDTLPVRGTEGELVLAVQRALSAAGTKVRGGIDGKFGSGTAATLAAFQTSKGLPSTGVLDASTARALGLIAPEHQPVTTSGATSNASAKTVTNSSARLNATSLPTRGDRSKNVRIVQQALVKAGFVVKGGVDGVFGRATASALRKFQSANGIIATGELNTATAIALGLIVAPSVKISVFPVQGLCGYSNTWHAPRSDGRLHLGVDIIAEEGNLVYAAEDGIITKMYTADKYERAGNGVRLTSADGTYFFYGHFSRFADGIALGAQVRAGQVIGYVGKTGDTNTPHLHFEVHPGGGEAVDPTPIVAAVDACKVTTPRPAPGT